MHSSRPEPVAPVWHTLVVIVIMLALSALSAHVHGIPTVAHKPNRIAGYVTTAGMEWLILAFIWFGLRLRKQNFRVLLGENWGGWKRVPRDLGIAVLYLIVANLVLALISHLLKTTTNDAIKSLLPHTAVEITAFFVVAATAGICEEITFRGYLQRQFLAWSNSAAFAIVLQGILFGASHGYQGLKLMLVIVVYGTMFGILAHWQRSLRPGMFAHFLQDFIGGVAGGRLMK
jgi:membrane protease YdiL (CAAX protease family)